MRTLKTKISHPGTSSLGCVQYGKEGIRPRLTLSFPFGYLMANNGDLITICTGSTPAAWEKLFVMSTSSDRSCSSCEA